MFLYDFNATSAKVYAPWWANEKFYAARVTLCDEGFAQTVLSLMVLYLHNQPHFMLLNMWVNFT